MRSLWYLFVESVAILLNEMKMAGRPLDVELAICPNYFDDGHMTRRLMEWAASLTIDGQVVAGEQRANSGTNLEQKHDDEVVSEELAHFRSLADDIFVEERLSCSVNPATSTPSSTDDAEAFWLM